MRRRFGLLALLAMAALAPGAASAQIFTPALLPPRQGSEMGLYLLDGFGTDELAVEGTLRRGFGPFDLGLRAGLGEVGEELAITLGADYRNPLELATAPLDLSITGGAQALLGGGNGIGFHAGLSVGSTFDAPPVSITPYLHPRLALVEDLGEEGFELEILADLGVDVQFSPNLVARLGVAFGSPTADFAIGVAWR